MRIKDLKFDVSTSNGMDTERAYIRFKNGYTLFVYKQLESFYPYKVTVIPSDEKAHPAEYNCLTEKQANHVIQKTQRK
jgi:hypothetical protein